MKKNIYLLSISLLTGIAGLLGNSSAQAQDQIIRPYQSVRSAGMGGVKFTTGLYDENFFGNPGRVTANPRFKITAFDPMIEPNMNAIGNVSELSGGGNFYSGLSNTAGENNHARIQTTMPAVYFAPGEGRWAFAFAMIMSTQADVNLHNSFSVDPGFVTDIGPAFTVGRNFLESKALSVGLTTHATYRINTPETFSFIDLIGGKSLSPSESGGQGTHVDFDLGATYLLPWEPAGIQFTTALALNNLLGGRYSNIPFEPITSITNRPREQSRSLGLGVAASKAQTGAFRNTTIAFELSDIGNNRNGSLFRLVHIGAETRYGILIPRLGLNQGYLAAGLGFDLRFVTLDLATYGEEMSLNVGQQQDRRVALRLAVDFN